MRCAGRRRSTSGPVVELIGRDPLRASLESPAPEDRAPYLAAFKAIDDDPAQLLCVVDDAEAAVVATMQLTFLTGMARRGASRLQIEAVRVDEALRGNGVGSAMIQGAVAEAGRRGATLVQLTSDNTRLDAHRFYDRLSFTQSHGGSSCTCLDPMMRTVDGAGVRVGRGAARRK